MKLIHCADLHIGESKHILAESYLERQKAIDSNRRTKMDHSKIVDIELSGIDMRDYPDFVDTYIISAVWDDTGLDLNDSELDELNEDSEFVYECIQDKLY